MAVSAVPLLSAAPAMASDSAKVVSAWGNNTYGQLGNGTDGNGTGSKVPTPVSGLNEVRSIAAGLSHGLALLKNGTVMAWGNNGSGGLGDGTITQRDSPVSVKGLSGVTAIGAGEGDSLALLENGTVMAWGRNDRGQLGLGTTVGPETCMSELPCSRTPVQVKGLSGVKAIAVGYDHNLALLNDGTVMAWGQNHWGELGTGTTGPDTCGDGWLCNPSPTPVTGISGVTAIAAGHGQGMALLENGTVMDWGYNNSGLLGIGTTSGPEYCGEGSRVSCSSTPVAVSGLSGVTAIAAGRGHNLALLSDGTVRAWGSNSNGQLGDGTNVNRSTPVPVSELSGVTALSGGAYHSMALLKDGTVRAWGWNLMWTLGNSTATEESRTPIPVSGLTGATVIAAGNMDSYALGDPPATFPKVSHIEPNVGSTAGGTEVTITGTDLANVTSVKFGSADAASFTVDSDTSITAVSPPGTGVVSVTVADASGSSYTSGRTYFWYGSVVESVEPNYGPASGGTPVDIWGRGFTGATAVRFGSRNAATFEVSSDWLIRAVSPPGQGTVEVIVESPVGTSSPTPWDQFEYWGFAPVEEPPVIEPVAEEPEVEEPPVEEPEVEEPEVEEPETEEPEVEEPGTEEPPVAEPVAEEPEVEEPPVEEPEVEEPPVAEPLAEESPANEPPVEGSPRLQLSAPSRPLANSPSMGEPTGSEPVPSAGVADSVQGEESKQVWSCVGRRGARLTGSRRWRRRIGAARLCRMDSASVASLGARKDLRGLRVRLMRGHTLYATGIFRRRHTKARLVLTPLKQLKAGRYVLRFTRHRRRMHELIVLR